MILSFLFRGYFGLISGSFRLIWGSLQSHGGLIAGSLQSHVGPIAGPLPAPSPHCRPYKQARPRNGFPHRFVHSRGFFF